MDPRDALQRIFGFERFRPGQLTAIEAALRDRDALVVMPTGSGKSLCYQLPALIRDDLTLVVSPLVSLMQDQVQALSDLAPGQVEVINAQRGAGRNEHVLARALMGEVRILYMSPERFAVPRFLKQIADAQVGLFVVDEAHCVSQWGHDFRPDYFGLADAARRVRAKATIALTATATPPVADDISRRLGLSDPVRVTTGFDRPTLSFSVVPCANPVEKQGRIIAALSEPDALPAIVYTGTRAASEQLAMELSAGIGAQAVAYHAGLQQPARATAQQRFMSGQVPVIVATNAFGMGIDKSDVRTVAHASVPASLEAYYQEAGRAGRDGRPANCILFAEQRDKGLHVFFIERARVEDSSFERVAERLRWAGLDGRYELKLAELGGVTSSPNPHEAVRAIIGHLARAGIVLPEPSPPERVAGRIVGEWDGRALARCRAYARDAERIRWAGYRAVWEYVERPRCRRRALLAHFGDLPPSYPAQECCDVCHGVGRSWAAPASAAPELDDAIVEVVRSARPAVGRTRAVEILRGGRSKLIAENSYDDLPAYGGFAHLRQADVLGRVDQLLASGVLRSSGGRFPKLRAPLPERDTSPAA